jgi:hypothetical protein
MQQSSYGDNAMLAADDSCVAVCLHLTSVHIVTSVVLLCYITDHAEEP